VTPSGTRQAVCFRAENGTASGFRALAVPGKSTISPFLPFLVREKKTAVFKTAAFLDNLFDKKEPFPVSVSAQTRMNSGFSHSILL